MGSRTQAHGVLASCRSASRRRGCVQSFEFPLALAGVIRGPRAPKCLCFWNNQSFSFQIVIRVDSQPETRKRLKFEEPRPNGLSLSSLFSKKGRQSGGLKTVDDKNGTVVNEAGVSIWCVEVSKCPEFYKSFTCFMLSFSKRMVRPQSIWGYNMYS